ncbi:hypothetical protein ScPMuIL_004195 [Solemya velum]
MKKNAPLTQRKSSDNSTLKLPPINERGILAVRCLDGMEARSSTQQLIFRSVPPFKTSYTISDLIEAERATGGSRQNMAGLGPRTPGEYAKRFKPRSTKKPHIIEFNASSVDIENARKKRATIGFFPSVKIRISSRMRSSEFEFESPSSRMHLEPSSYTDIRPRSTASRSGCSSQPLVTPDSSRTFHENSIIYPNIAPESMDFDDLSYLPPPKRIMPKRENPWVFRYKVKRSMNELAKIMASKPQPVIEQTVF